MAVVSGIGFSPSGEYFVYSSPDGTLKIWETSTGNLTQEYTPSSHLSATCTCLSWGPSRQCPGASPSAKKKKKRRSQGAAERPGEDLIAMGTSSGSLLLYSIVKGDLHTQLTDGHSDTVNGVCWHPKGLLIYSCSNDHHIVEWCLSTSTVKRKWKAGMRLYSVSLCHSEKHLLSAGRTIKLWDLEKLKVIKTFTGHASEVFRLLPVPVSNQSSVTMETEENSVDGSYFLSAAVNDRLINAWQVQLSSQDKSALASFALPDDPGSVCIHRSQQATEGTLLVAVTKSGQLLIFEHTLNGRLKKPLKPTVTLQIATDVTKSDVTRPIPVLCACVCDDPERSVLLAHGNFIKPTFEKLHYASLEKHMCLVREDPRKTVMYTENEVSRIKVPGVSSDATVLAPGHMAPAVPSREVDGKARKKRKKSTEMSMEDRLYAISIDHPQKHTAKQPPKADTLATLLAQGLISNDKKILNNVLQNSNEVVIRNTVKRLPVPVIVPLVHELTRRMHGHAQSGQKLVKWIRTVLNTHTSYLMTFPALVDTFGSLYEMMNSRVTVFGRLSKLQGKLDLMLSQVTSQEEEGQEETAAQAMLVYQDESSDDDMGMEDIVPDQSESEDNWEDMDDLNGVESESDKDREESESSDKDQEESMSASDDDD